MPRLTIEVQEIIILVNYAWEQSFARIDCNRTAIVERGWFPLNRNLLLDKQLRSTMTTEEQDEEAGEGVILPYTASDNYAIIDETAPTIDVQYLPPVAAHQKPNVQNGMAAWCLDAIVANQDLMESRLRIKKNREDGQSMSEKLKNIKRMTAATMFLCGTTRLGEDIKDSVQRSFLNHAEKQAESQRNAEEAHRKNIQAYDDVMALNLSPTSWNVSQLKVVLKPLKTKDDGAMPALKADLLAKWYLWNGRPINRSAPVVDIPPILEEGNALHDPERNKDEGVNEHEECIEAMLMLNQGVGAAQDIGMVHHV